MFLIPAILLLVSQNQADIQIISQVESFGFGKHFSPWMSRIKRGDPWALAELTMECENLVASLEDNHIGAMAKMSIPQIKMLLASNPGKANYYLARMTYCANFHTSTDDSDMKYLEYLETASRYGYAMADYRLFHECFGNGKYGVKYQHRLSKEQIKEMKNKERAVRHQRESEAVEKGKETLPPPSRAIRHDSEREEWQRQQADGFKRLAIERLIPLAQQGDGEAAIALFDLLEPPLPEEIKTNYDRFCTQSQAKTWIEEAAKKGNVKAQKYVLRSRMDAKSLGKYAEDSQEFRSFVKMAEAYDPDSIQELVDYYYFKKNWAKAQYWATKGREALGQSNQWLDRAFDEGKGEAGED